MINGNLASGGISFTGLGSGTDFDSIIEKLIEVESLKKKRLEIWKSSWEKKIEGFQELNTKLLSLKTSLQAMDRPGEFLVKNTSSTDSAALTATATADAEEGSYVFSINQLAQNQILTFNTPATSLNTVVNNSGTTQTFTYTYAGTDHTVNVPNGTTLGTLINIINADGGNLGVRASAIKVSEGEYRMQLRGLDTGAAKTLTIAGSTTLSGYQSGDVTVSQSAQDAQFRLNNFPSNAWLTRATNSIDDVVPGLTVLFKSTSANVTVNVETDIEGIKEHVRTFVNQINEVRSFLKELTKIDSMTNKGSLLSGNYGVAMISQNLKNITASKGLGFEYFNSATGTGDMYTTLSQLGILTDADAGSVNSGLLILNEDRLDEVLKTNLDDVVSLFSAHYEGSATVTQPSDNPAAFTYYNSIQGTTKGGTYAVSYSLSGGVVTGATIGGYPARFDSETGQITATTGPATGLAIQLNTFDNGTYSGSVSLKVGKVTELINELNRLTDTREGTLNILEDNYRDIIENIQKKIEFEERRLKNNERNLRDRFARLEATLSNYNGIQGMLQNQIKQLPSGSE